MTGDRIRVVLVDDHAVVRAGLRAVLDRAPDIEVVDEASSGRAALAAIERHEPHVVVMDLDMADGDGVSTTREIVGRKLAARVLILTMHAEEECVQRVIEAGAAGFVIKTAADRELIDAVRAVAYGDVYVRPAASRRLARDVVPTAPDRQRFEKLSEREQDVLRLVAHGFSGPEIGAQLTISAKTVDTYRQRIREKIGFTHRADYVRFALKLGLLTAD